LESTKGLQISILNSEYDVLYSSGGLGRNTRMMRPQRRDMPGGQSLSDMLLKNRGRQLMPGEMVFENSRDFRLNSIFIQFLSPMNNGDLLYLVTPVEAIEESVQIANQFFLFTGLLTIVIGTLLVYYITGKFTKPILKLNSITKKMAVLDFSTRYDVKTGDQIGQLGESINSLSVQLQSSIQELKESNRKLQEDIKQERKIDEMRKEFISNVSHELKTPLALIQGYAEGLKLNVIEQEEDKNTYCDIIMDESGKMNKLVKQLLDLSQIESGCLQLDRTGFDIADLVEPVRKKSVLVFKEKQIQVISNITEGILVNADYDRAEQVLMNYISNAVNHVDYLKRICISLEQRDDKARIKVFNSGSPIPEDSMDKIWTSFYKVDKARTRAYGGTGLGLSIVRAVQEAHKNGYGVNNVDGGVEFWFELDIIDEMGESA
jgi:two-component system, OmpR family, sensor histidine kinase VanS